MVARTVTFAVRSSKAGSEGLLNEMREVARTVSPNLVIVSLQTMQAVYDQSLSQTSFAVVMLSIAGTMALLLGIIGLYGVIAYSVSQRRREIAIRLALGAQPRKVKRMFLQNGVALCMTGIIIGVVAASMLTRAMSSLLFGISTRDPVTYFSVPLILLTVAIFAAYLPARRAASLAPIETLRTE